MILKYLFRRLFSKCILPPDRCSSHYVIGSFGLFSVLLTLYHFSVIFFYFFLSLPPSSSPRIAFRLNPKFDNTLKPGCSGMLTHLKRSIPDLRQHKIHLQPLTSHDYLAKQSEYISDISCVEVDWPDRARFKASPTCGDPLHQNPEENV